MIRTTAKKITVARFVPAMADGPAVSSPAPQHPSQHGRDRPAPSSTIG